MPVERDNPFRCDTVGCPALRREINHWYVVLADESGVHIYEWEKAPKKAMEEGHHFCGLAHTIKFVSKVLTPDTPSNPDRESTVVLNPPLDRDGKSPEPKDESIEAETQA